jgi:hypothetical protein
MKNKLYIIAAIWILLTTIFAVMYWVKPRVMNIEKIVEIIPDNINISFPMEPPDSSIDTTYADVQKPIKKYTKTFHKALINEDKQSLANITSVVNVVSDGQVYSIDNQISAIPNKALIGQEIMKQVPSNSSFSKGFLYGTLATITAGTITYLATR